MRIGLKIVGLGAWRRVVVASLLTFVVTLLSGCSNLDFGRGPIESIADAMDSGKPFVEVDKEATNRQKARFEKAVELWAQDHKPVKTDYRIGRGDVVTVEIAALEGPGRITRVDRTVRTDGAIELPLIGDIVAAGYSTFELQKRIAEAYDGRFLKNPQVVVVVVDYRSVGVLVGGAVARPQMHYLKENETTLMGALAIAGGLSASAGNEVWLIRPKEGAQAMPTGAVASVYDALTNAAPDGVLGGDNDGGATNDAGAEALADIRAETNRYDVVSVDVARLLDMADPRLNLVVKGGDIVNVPPEPRSYVYVFGYVGRPGAFEIRGDSSMTALRLLAIAGGVSSQGRADKSYLLRQTGKGRERIKVDLAKVANGVRPDVNMEPGDVLVVGAGLLMKLTEIFRVGGSAMVGGSAVYSPTTAVP